MLRRFCGVLLTLVMTASAGADLLACGDKFLRIGRSARFRRYASVHPSAILIYAPRWTANGITSFEALLRRGGHRPVTVTTVAAMSQAFAAAKYDMVIANYPDAATVTDLVGAFESRPLVLPLVYKPTKNEETAARAAYTCMLRPDKMNNSQALAEIDRLFDLQSKESGVPVRRR